MTSRRSRSAALVGMALGLVFALAPALRAGDEKETPPPVPTVKFAKIKLSGAMDEGLAPTPPIGPSPLNFRGVLGLLEKAAGDPELEGILLEIKSPAIGFAKVQQLHRGLTNIRDRGKKIYLHSEDLSSLTLMLGSIAHRVSIPESGFVMLPGLGAEAMYFRELFDLLGIRFDVTHVGAFKSAYENFSKEEMSQELREVLDCLLDEYWNTMVTLIAEGRGIPRSTVERAIDRGFQTPEEARRCGLVDAVEYQDQFKSWLESQYPGKKLEILTKYGRPQGADLDLNNPFAVFTQIAQLMNPKTDDKGGEKAPRIALIYAVGAITSGKSQVDPFSGASSSMGSETMVAAIRKAAEDDSVKAIVMRVDSPGGSGLASDMIWREVVRAKAKKPFVVSMSDVAGSGGYYIAMAADSIIAEPTTLTGSIGVVSMFIDMTRLIRRVGINVETVSRGKSAGMFSPFTRKSDEQRQRFAGYMEAFYRDFVSKVAEGRGMSFEDTEKLARGRVWTGRQAKEIGLVDELGGLELAFSLARKKAGLPEDCEVIELPQPRNFFEVLSEMFGGGGLIGLTGSDRDGLLAALPAEARLLLATDEGREVLDKIRTVLGVAMDENDRRLLLVPFDIVIR